MPTNKTFYLETLRATTAYPTYRGFITVITFVLYAMAGLGALGTLVSAFAAMSVSAARGIFALLFGGLFSVLGFFLARFFKEAALVLVDIGDSVIESNARTATND